MNGQQIPLHPLELIKLLPLLRVDLNYIHDMQDQ
jgi:hypothetical protein